MIIVNLRDARAQRAKAGKKKQDIEYKLRGQH